MFDIYAAALAGQSEGSNGSGRLHLVCIDRFTKLRWLGGFVLLATAFLVLDTVS